ncbi:hypothetical protein JKF63_00126 [Porcisia hertigi]|uniref:Amino acid transporter transmembrane domain-containing protein n=1 Tax=Porcisia hertigi TaxID=2761500 RepID=A0A836HPF9_9TRYP|nr:hypothetical protein JKF63_00126 [Porcisia hertigi]
MASAAGCEGIQEGTLRQERLTPKPGGPLGDGGAAADFGLAQLSPAPSLGLLKPLREEARSSASRDTLTLSAGRVAEGLASTEPRSSLGEETVLQSQGSPTSNALHQSTLMNDKLSSPKNTSLLAKKRATATPSSVQTLHTRRSEVQLLTIASLAVTTAQDGSSRGGTADMLRTDLDRNSRLLDLTGVAGEDGSVIDVCDPGSRANHAESRERSGRSMGELHVEHSNVGLEASAMSNGSLRGRQDDGDYASLYGAAFHIFKANVGAGVFLLPTYYQDAGYLMGGVLVVLLGALMIDCAASLLRVKHRIKHPEVKTYPTVVEFVLGGYSKTYVQFALVFTQLGFCVMFLQYASSMFAALFDKHWAYAAFVGLSTVAVTPMTILSSKLHLLVYASLLAGVFVLLVLAGTTALDIETLLHAGVASGVAAVAPNTRLLAFVSGHIFSLEGIGVVLPVENSVLPRKRVQFGEVLRYTLVAIVSLYIFFGVLGYMAYGQSLHTSVVLALPPGVGKRILQVLLGLSLIFGFPIQYVPAIQILDKACCVKSSSDKKGVLLRVVLNALLGLIAAFIGGDTINAFASFLGSFAGVHLMITLPTLLVLQVDHALNRDRDRCSSMTYILLVFKGPYSLARCRYYVYLLFAAVVWFGGLYDTAVSLFGVRGNVEDFAG